MRANIHKTTRKTACTYTIVVVFAWLLLPWGIASAGMETDFLKGKLQLKQKLFKDAMKTLLRASKTAKGQRHFGVLYYLAVTQYRLGLLRQSMASAARAKSVAMTQTQKAGALQIKQRIQALFGKLKIRNKVSADVSGRLLIQLNAAEPMYNDDKKRVFQVVKRRWQRYGKRPNGRAVYLPKGAYSIALAAPQCRRFRLERNGQPIRATKLNVGDGTVALDIVAKPGCACPKGQVFAKGGCIKAVVSSHTHTSWAPLGIALGVVAGAVVVGGAVAAVYFFGIAPNTNPIPSRVGRTLW